MMPKKHPDFEQLLKVLRREPTEKPVLFEFIINDGVLEHLAGGDVCRFNDDLRQLRIGMHGFVNAGYDYAVIPPWHAGFMNFPTAGHDTKSSYSINEGGMIKDWRSFENYPWPNPENYDYDKISRLGREMPNGIKFIACGYGGLLETAIALTGFENLCMMALMDEELTMAIFNEIGQRIFRYFDFVSSYTEVGAIIHADDWGFKTQSMFPIDLMEKFVYPFHKRITDMVHAKGKPMILHSCGYPVEVMEGIIELIGYDGKHSYEDGIVPVEDAYERWHERVAILGGIDVDFMARSTPEAIYQRAVKLIEQTQSRGGYALGSGNSIPTFIPTENYLAMLRAFESYY